jgi:hypothetical protein
MCAMQHYIDLSRWTKCAEGSQREIYQNPEDPDMLVKVIKAHSRGERGARKSARKMQWLRRFRRFGAYMTFHREIDEYLEQARKLNSDETFGLPIPRILGLTHTSNGLGLLVERIANRDGTLSPTLPQLIFAGRFSDNHLRLIDQFFDRCRENHLVLMDVNPKNFVVTDRSGREEIFCIDGTGEKHFFKIYAASRSLNNVRLHFARRKLLEKIGRFEIWAQEKAALQANLAACPAAH